MFIAHLPSGYLMSIALLERIKHLPVPASMVILAGMLGALAPDFDLSYFYLVDQRQTHHHRYVTHWPLLWLVLAAVSAVWLRCSRESRGAVLALVFCLGSLLHIVLDSFVGDIWWLAPFVDRPYALFTVPALVQPWWLNFMIHWSFAVELAICGWALLVRRRRVPKALRRA
jgi:Predicted membrane-bound metal-dependent hydrolase (DUF457).